MSTRADRNMKKGCEQGALQQAFTRVAFSACFRVVWDAPSVDPSSWSMHATGGPLSAPSLS